MSKLEREQSIQKQVHKKLKISPSEGVRAKRNNHT